jgi:hypothetical protein
MKTRKNTRAKKRTITRPRYRETFDLKSTWCKIIAFNTFGDKQHYVRSLILKEPKKLFHTEIIRKAEYHGRVVNAPGSYSRSPGFDP